AQALNGTNVKTADLDPANVSALGTASTLGDDVGLKLAAYQARYQGGLKKAMRLYGNAALTGVQLTQLPYDSQGNAHYELVFDAPAGFSQLLLETGAHVSVGTDPFAGLLGPNDDVGYGAGKGAASISGSPFHVSIDLFDNGCNPGSACGGSNGGA